MMAYTMIIQWCAQIVRGCPSEVSGCPWALVSLRLSNATLAPMGYPTMIDNQ